MQKEAKVKNIDNAINVVEIAVVNEEPGVALFASS